MCVKPGKGCLQVKPPLFGSFLQVMLGYWSLWHSDTVQQSSCATYYSSNIRLSIHCKVIKSIQYIRISSAEICGYLCWNYSRGITRVVPSVWVFWLQMVLLVKPLWTYHHHLWNKSTELENILRLSSSINLTAFILMMPIIFIKWNRGIHGPKRMNTCGFDQLFFSPVSTPARWRLLCSQLSLLDIQWMLK